MGDGVNGYDLGGEEIITPGDGDDDGEESTDDDD
jgi:hypothetical protein